MILAPPHETQRSQYSWRGTLVACCLNVVAMPLDILLAREVPSMPTWPPLLSGAAGALLAVVMLARRRRSTARLCATVFLLNTLVILAALWIISGAYAAAPGCPTADDSGA